MDPLTFTPDAPDDEHELDYRVVWTTWGQPIVRRLFFNRPIRDTWADVEALAFLLQALDDMGSAVTVLDYRPMTLE